MIFNKKYEKIETNLKNSKEFNIAMNSKTFTMLSDTLYSNKIKAIIRELSCNAYDSHIAANNLNKQFEIFLPTILNPIFSIRDYGTGIQEELFDKIVLTYGESTKNDTDTQIGCFGIGFKSPFSYIDLFTVISYYNGIKYTYSIYLNNGIPTATKVFEQLTNESNGVNISFNVNKDDIKEFKEATKEVFKYFNFLPKFNIDIDIKKDYFQINNELYSINLNGESNKRIFAIQGNIAYPVDLSKINELPFLYNCLDLHFDIGSFAFVPSREALSYDKSTINVINARINLIKENILNDMKIELNQSNNLLDYTKNLIKKINLLNLKNKEINEYKLNIFNGIVIDLSNNYKHLSLKDTDFKILNDISNINFFDINIKKNKYNKSLLYFHIIENYTMILNDLGKDFKIRKFIDLFNNNKTKLKKNNNKILFLETKDLNDINIIENNYGNNVNLLSTLIDIKDVEIKQDNKLKGKMFILTDYMFDPIQELKEIDLNKNYYYIEIENKTTKKLTLKLFNQLIEIEKGIHFSNLIPKNSQIIFVNKSFIKFNENNKIKSFEYYIKSNFKIKMKNFIKYKEFEDFLYHFKSDYKLNFYDLRKKELLEIDNDFKEINKITKIYKRIYRNKVNILYRDTGSKIYNFIFNALYNKDKHNYINFINFNYSNFIEKYPLLKYLDSRNNNDYEFVNYIKERKEKCSIL